MPAHRKAWVCSVEGCGNPHSARGWCHTHYGRWRRHGDPLAAVNPVRYAPSDKCRVEGCPTRARSLGWCPMHYMRWRRNGDPLALQEIGVCSIDGCDSQLCGRGWCRLHYQRWAKYGHPLWPYGTPSTCLVCTHPQRLEIEQQAAMHVPRDSFYNWSAIGRRFGLNGKVVQRHNSTEHARHLAKSSLARLEQAQQMVAS